MSVKHKFVSGRGDNGDAGAVNPSNWDDDHELSGTLATIDALAPLPNMVLTFDGTATATMTPIASFAPTFSPVFTGAPIAPTAPAATNSTQIATTGFVATAIANLVASAPSTLNTLNELATALGNDANFSATITAALGNRLRVDAAQGLSTGQKAQGLSNLGVTIGTGANNVVQLDGSAKLPAVDGSQLTNLPSGTVAAQADAQTGTDNTKTMTALRVAQAFAVRSHLGHIFGLILSNDATTPNTVIDIAAGESASQNALLMSAGAFTKNCNAAWAVGSGNGALDSGSSLAASTTYHMFQIMRTDTWVVDYLLSTSATAPSMPSGYTEKRLIMSFNTDASAHITQFTQVDDEVYLKASALDYSNTSATTNTDIPITLSVPTGIRVQPLIRFVGETDSGGNNSANIAVRSPDLMAAENQPAVDSITVAGVDAGVTANGSGATRIGGGQMRIRTNTLGQVVARPYNTSGVTTMAVYVRTYGFVHPRGRLS